MGERLKRMKLARCQNARTAANHHSQSRWSKEPRRDTSGEPQFLWKLKLSLFQVGSKGLWSLSTHVHYRQLGIRGKLYKSYKIWFLFFSIFNQTLFYQKWYRWASSICKTLPKGKTDPSTLTHSTSLVRSRPLNKLWNLGQTSAWFCLAKGENYMKTALTNPNVTTKSRRQKSPARSKDLLGLQTFDW